MSHRRIDPATWKRRPHFDLFEAMDHPWFDICTEVDVTEAWELCRAPGGPSFFAATLFFAIGACNEVEEFRTRIRSDAVIVHDEVFAGSTVMRDDETFGFGYFETSGPFPEYAAAVAAEVERVRVRTGDLPDRQIDHVVHFSVLPWMGFSSIGQPRHRGWADSIPKIVIGRAEKCGGRWTFPVAISVHHGLVDGLHAARFYAALQRRFRRAETLLAG